MLIFSEVRTFLLVSSFLGFSCSLLYHLYTDPQYITFSKMITNYPLCVMMRIFLLTPIIISTLSKIVFESPSGPLQSIGKYTLMLSNMIIISSLLLMTTGDGYLSWKLHTALTYLFVVVVEINQPILVLNEQWTSASKRNYLLFFYAIQIIPIVVNPWSYRVIELGIVYYYIVRLYFNSVDRTLAEVNLTPIIYKDREDQVPLAS